MAKMNLENVNMDTNKAFLTDIKVSFYKMFEDYFNEARNAYIDNHENKYTEDQDEILRFIQNYLRKKI